jgi:predicted metal-dependent hydrolase
VDNFQQQSLFLELPPSIPQISNRKIKSKPAIPADLPNYQVIRSQRRRSNMTAYRQGGIIVINIPARMSKKDEVAAIAQMIAMVEKREAKERKSDHQLLQIGIALLNKYLPEFEVKPASINWRDMSERWGSCTTVDRTIRISERLVGAPAYVLNYIIFHELIHLMIAGHDEDFYSYLNRYEDQSRAEAFLEGFEVGCQFGDSTVTSAINI